MTQKTWICNCFIPSFFKVEKKYIFCLLCQDSTWIKMIKHRVCQSSYPAGRCLWFRIFEENQTVPNQNYPRRAPILSINNKHMYTGQMDFSSGNVFKCHNTKQTLSNWPLLSLMGAASPQFPASFCNLCLVQETSFLQLLRTHQKYSSRCLMLMLSHSSFPAQGRHKCMWGDEETVTVKYRILLPLYDMQHPERSHLSRLLHHSKK